MHNHEFKITYVPNFNIGEIEEYLPRLAAKYHLDEEPLLLQFNLHHSIVFADFEALVSSIILHLGRFISLLCLKRSEGSDADCFDSKAPRNDDSRLRLKTVKIVSVSV